MDIVQIGGSLFAIVVLALIAKWLFPTKAELTEERIVRNVARYCPETEFDASTDRVFVSEDKKHAVFVFGNPDFGIATASALGDRVVVRHYPDLSQISFHSKNGELNLISDDFTQPSFSVTLEQAPESELLSMINMTSKKEAKHAHA